MKIDYDKVQVCIGELQRTIDNINDILDEVSGLKTKIINKEYWVGIAAGSYVDMLRIMSSKFDGISIELKNAVAYLNQTVESYKETDKITVGLIET